MKLIEKYFKAVTANRFPAFDALKEEGRWKVRTNKAKDVVQLFNIRSSGWNTYAWEIDDDSLYIGDKCEGMEYLMGLGIDVESEGVKKEVLSILENHGLELSEYREISHVITRDTWNKKENVFLALSEIEDIGEIYMKYKKIFGENKC